MKNCQILIEKVPYDRKVVVIPMPNLVNSLITFLLIKAG